MIELTPNGAIMLYLCLTVTTILGFWLYQHYKTRKKTIIPIEEKLYLCEYCHFVYLDKHPTSITKCPQCQLLNKSTE